MSDQTQALSRPIEKLEKEKALSYIPLGYVDEIKLSAEIVKKYFCQPTKSGQVCSDRDATRFVLLCQTQRLNPAASDCYLVGYDSDKGPQFSMIVSHAALLKRAESMKDEYEGMLSGIIYREKPDGEIKEREGDFFCAPEIVLGGWARVFRKGRKETYRRASIAATKPNYPSAFWRDGKEASQIVKCAESDALRSAFPSLCGELYIDGEHRANAIEIESAVVSDKRPEATGLTKALNAPAREKKKEEAAPEPTQEAATPAAPAPEPDPVAELAAQETAAEAAATQPAAFKPRPGESDNLTTVRSLLHAAGKTEEQFLEFGLKNPRGAFIKENQKLADLSDAKHQVIIKQWKELLKLMG